MVRMTRLKRRTSMGSIAFPTRMPGATGPGILAGITNMTRLNRLPRLARITRPTILGNC